MKINRHFYKIAALAFLFLLCRTLPAQVTKIMGSITDASTQEPLPFTNIVIAGTTIGTLTDFEGKYSIEFGVHADSVRASLIGFTVMTNVWAKLDAGGVPSSVSMTRIVAVPLTSWAVVNVNVPVTESIAGATAKNVAVVQMLFTEKTVTVVVIVCGGDSLAGPAD